MLRPIGMGRSAMKRQQKLKLRRVKVWRHGSRSSGRSNLAYRQQLEVRVLLFATLGSADGGLVAASGGLPGRNFAAARTAGIGESSPTRRAAFPNRAGKWREGASGRAEIKEHATRERGGVSIPI